MKQHVCARRDVRATHVRVDAGSQEDAHLEEDLRSAFHAHLAVAYHNTAVELAQNQHMLDASATAKLAQELAATTLPAKHRWVHLISSTVRLLSDMHRGMNFVTQQVRLPQVRA